MKMGNRFINPVYLQQETIEKIKELYKSDSRFPSVKLEKFLPKEAHGQLFRQATKAKFKRECRPDRESFSKAGTPKPIKRFLDSAEFSGFLSRVLGKKAAIGDSSLFRLEWKSYVLLHDEEDEKPGIDIVLEFTPAWDEMWGGAITYRDAEGEFRTISDAENTLFIIERKKGIRQYVKYVNHRAGKSKRIFLVGRVKTSGVNSQKLQ